MATRDFDAMLADSAKDRLTFVVGGQEFTLRARLPYQKWNELLQTMRSDETDGNQATAEFFNTVLIKRDRQRFLDLLAHDGEDDEDGEDEDVVDLVQMDQITDWIMEHFTGKLRRSSDSSSPGANGTGQPRKVVSLSARGAS